MNTNRRLFGLGVWVILYATVMFGSQTVALTAQDVQSKTLEGVYTPPAKVKAGDLKGVTEPAWTELQASTAKVKLLSVQNLNLRIEACDPSITTAFKAAQKDWSDWLKANVPDGYDVKPDLSGIAKREPEPTK